MQQIYDTSTREGKQKALDGYRQAVIQNPGLSFKVFCVSLSRHNSLFFCSHAGAVRGCIFYSLACSCRNLGINFFDYISDILNKAAALPPNAPIHKYCELLPDKWIKSKQGQ